MKFHVLKRVNGDDLDQVLWEYHLNIHILYFFTYSTLEIYTRIVIEITWCVLIEFYEHIIHNKNLH